MRRGHLVLYLGTILFGYLLWSCADGGKFPGPIVPMPIAAPRPWGAMGPCAGSAEGGIGASAVDYGSTKVCNSKVATMYDERWRGKHGEPNTSSVSDSTLYAEIMAEVRRKCPQWFGSDAGVNDSTFCKAPPDAGL